MTLRDIIDWLENQIDCPQFYQNSIGGAPRSIALYDNRRTAPPRIAIGGLANTSYQVKPVTFLIHWGKSSNESEAKAQELYDLLFGQSATIAGKRVIKFEMTTPAPVNVGTDSEGYHEYVVETNIFYEVI